MKKIFFRFVLFLNLTNSAVAQIIGGLPPLKPIEQKQVSPQSNFSAPFKPYSSFENLGFTAPKMYVKQFRTLTKKDCLPFSKKNNVDGLFCMYVIHTLAKEIDSAFPYALKAAELGNPIAQYEIINLYKKGLGIPKNQEASIYWNKKCVESKVASCEVNLGWNYMDSKSQLPIDYSQAMQLNLLGFEHGHAEGASNVGMLYEMGWGVPVDYDLAADWYKKAIRGSGSSGQAETRLANLYVLGLGVKKDHVEAKRLYKYVQDEPLFHIEYRKAARFELDSWSKN